MPGGRQKECRFAIFFNELFGEFNNLSYICSEFNNTANYETIEDVSRVIGIIRGVIY